jgi:hypothetical protein
MKNILFSMLTLCLSISMQGQPPVFSGSIRIIPSHQGSLTVEVENLLPSSRIDGELLLLNLVPGQYRVRIVGDSGRGGGRNRHHSSVILYEGAIHVHPRERTVITTGGAARTSVYTEPDMASILLCIAPPPPVQPEIYPMSRNDFERLINELERANFDSERLELVKTAARLNWFLSDQLGDMMQLFPFYSTQNECARAVIPRVVDPENLHLQVRAIKFPADRESYLKLVRTHY